MFDREALPEVKGRRAGSVPREFKGGLFPYFRVNFFAIVRYHCAAKPPDIVSRKSTEQFSFSLLFDLNFLPNRTGMVLTHWGAAMPLSQCTNRLENLLTYPSRNSRSLAEAQERAAVEMRKDLMLRTVAQRMQEQQFEL